MTSKNSDQLVRRIPGISGRRRFLLAVLVVVGVAGAVTIASLPRCPNCNVLGVPSKMLGAEQVTITPDPNAHDVDPVAHVVVKANAGTLTDVRMFNDGGKPVEGVMTPDNTVWKPTVPLGYGRTYTLRVSSHGPNGVDSTQVSSFSTLRPSNQTRVSFTTTSEAALKDGGTYGVGTVVVAHFDEQIANRAAAEKQLTVTTNPSVQGSWFWVDDQNVHWRPEHYYTPGTTVTAEAKIYGISLGKGLFGQEDSKVSFRIGDAHVSIADDATKLVSVFDNGALVRTMPTSMGMGGTENVGAQNISLWTPPGIYTVLDKGNPVVMDSSTFGLPKNSRLGYRETINYATRISTDGIYLHELDATVWAQGHTDTSHGCLNLNADNAKWFYGFSVPGDVVEIRNSGRTAVETGAERRLDARSGSVAQRQRPEVMGQPGIGRHRMGDMESNRRSLLMAAAPLLLAAVAAGDKTGTIGDVPLAPAPKTGPDPNETFTLPYEKMSFESWGNLPPHSGEMQ